MCHRNVGMIKMNNLNQITTIWTVAYKKIHALEQSHSSIIGAISERTTFVPSGRYLICMVAKRRLFLKLLLYCTNKYSLQNYLWGPLRASTMFFWVRSFSEIFQNVKQNVWLDKIWTKSIKYLYSGRSSF